jgi:type I restriction enzyme M protein
LNTLSKLGQNGVGVVLLANGALSAGGEEYEIRKRMIENDIVESIIIMPQNMFYTTNISVTIWVLKKNKKTRIEKRLEENITYRNRSDEILFMDLRQMGHPYEKKYIEFTKEDRAIIVDRFKSWRLDGYKTPYKDIPEFCYSAKKTEIVEKDYSLVPSRYIEFVQAEDDSDYDEKMTQLQGELKELLIQELQSREDLLEVMKGLGYGIEI